MGIHMTVYVGERIREIRKNKGFTQEQLGEKVGLPQPYIGGIERGERNISLETLERILDALQHTPSEFFQDFKNDNLSKYEKAKEEIIKNLYQLLAERTVDEIQLIEQLAQNVLDTIDSYKEKNNLS